MIRSELVQAVAASHPGLTMREIDHIVSVFFDQISDQLVKGGRVELRGFGAFSTRARDERMGRNPRTGEPVAIEAKRVLYFKAGKQMSKRLNLGG
jgi:integration host factor subunit beta